MKAVILAAGRGTRMGPLTADRPKPMIEIAGKNLLEHKILNLPDSVDEVIMVVGHMKEKIIEYFGDFFNGKKITYVDQGEAKGAGHALWKAKDALHGATEFLSLMGDDLYTKESLEEIAKHDWAMTVFPHKSFKTAGDVRVDGEGNISDVVFDDAGTLDKDVLVDICLYKLHTDIFKTEPVLLSVGNEFGLPHTIFKHVKENGVKMKVIQTKKWLKLNSPEEVAAAEIVVRNGF